MPGNLAELRPLIVIVSFMAVFFLLVGIIPAQFFPPAITNGTQVNGVVNANGYSFLIANDSTFLNLSGGAMHPDPYVQRVVAGGWNLACISYVYPDDPWFVLATYKQLYGLDGDVDYFRWYELNGTEVSVEAHPAYSNPPIDYKYTGDDTIFFHINHTLNNDFLANNSLTYTVKNSKTKITVSFAFNQTEFGVPLTAWYDDGLEVTFYVEYNDRASSFSALDLIFGFLTFQEIPGIDANISRIIAIPMWIGVAYLIYIFIIKTIGAIFGGG